MKNLIKFLNRKVMIGDTLFKIHSVFTTVLFICIFAVWGHAYTNFHVVSLIPGTSGTNWTVPTGVSDLEIQSAATGNWTDLTFWNTNQNQTVNWANYQSIYPGSVWHDTGLSSNGDNITIRCHDAACATQISYITKNSNN